MLESLSIRNIVLIERLDLTFGAGLNVLTGETGAGKSILLDALGFALGRRDGRGLIREGAEEGVAEATLICPDDHPSKAMLEEAGISWDPDALTLRRVVSSAGRSRAFANDQRIGGDLLRAVGETLVEVHGQQDDRGLTNARGHRAILDQFAGADADLAATRDSWRAARAAARALDEARAAAKKASADREYIAHAVEELTALAPTAGEDDALDTRRRMMQAAERIRDEVAAAATSLGAEGAEGAAHDAMRRLDSASSKAEGALETPIEALSRAIEGLAEAQAGVEAALDAMTFDPHELEQVEERLFALRGLARKHGCAPDDLAGLSEDLAAKLALIDGGEAALGELEAELEGAEAAYDAAAAKLSKRRKSAAGDLDRQVAEELPPLKLERARFETAIEALDQPGESGAERAEFRIATNPGAAAGPLAAIASGGELSRFLLALKVALASRAPGGVMIFDEIDRGVGGATADAVGRRLAALAEGAQVLVVTHSPQVAARGAAHFRIAKAVEGEATLTSVEKLERNQSRDEIARMLSGDHVTDAARAAADALISG
ncbi:MAG: DNA repair protein RecN [Pseudomonadota bacterium]